MASAEARYQQDLSKEAGAFSGTQNEKVRSLAWGSIKYFQNRLHEELDIVKAARSIIGNRNDLKALTMACGDMSGEYRLFKALGISSVDAFDVSEGQQSRFYTKVNDGQIPVDYKIADVNEIILPERKYDVVYMQQSLHHIVKIDRITEQIRSALKPDGIFILNDYVGEPFLQRGPKQRNICGKIWKCLPERFRMNVGGTVLEEIHIPNKAGLSPFEAVRSDAILPSIARNFDVVKQFLFGGVLFPIVNGFAPNYNYENETDRMLIHMLWELDKILVANGTVEPTFVRGVYRPKSR
jgi:SAM-dependent methyltransferase